MAVFLTLHSSAASRTPDDFPDLYRVIAQSLAKAADRFAGPRFWAKVDTLNEYSSNIKKKRIAALGEDQIIVFVLDAVDVVGMEMRDDDAPDRVRIEPGGNEVVVQRAGRGRDLAAGAGIDDN